jgi:hypothetical protein
VAIAHNLHHQQCSWSGLLCSCHLCTIQNTHSRSVHQMEDAQRSHNQGHVFAVVQDGLGRVVLAQQAHQHPCRMRVHHAWPWSWPWHVITQSKQCAIAIPTRHRSDMACVREVSASKSKSHVHFRPGVIDTHASQVMTINQIELKSYALCNACKLAIARHCGLPSFTCFVLVAHSTSLSLSCSITHRNSQACVSTKTTTTSHCLPASCCTCRPPAHQYGKRPGILE